MKSTLWVFVFAAGALLAARGAQAQITSGELVGYGAVYDLTWDGWNGTLTLKPGAEVSTLVSGGKTHRVTYTILRDPQEFIDGQRAPGYLGVNMTAKHRIRFKVDFNDTVKDASDDQVFDGYVFTQQRQNGPAVAGVTWWRNMPYGFYMRLTSHIVP